MNEWGVQVTNDILGIFGNWIIEIPRLKLPEKTLYKDILNIDNYESIFNTTVVEVIPSSNPNKQTNKSLKKPFEEKDHEGDFDSSIVNTKAYSIKRQRSSEVRMSYDKRLKQS